MRGRYKVSKRKATPGYAKKESKNTSTVRSAFWSNDLWRIKVFTWLTAKRVVTRAFPPTQWGGGRCVQYANMAFSFSGIGVDNRCAVPSWIYVLLQFSVPFSAVISLHYIVIHQRLRSWRRRRSSVDLGQVVMLMALSQFSTGSSGWPVPQIDCEMCPLCLWCLTRQNKQSLSAQSLRLRQFQ